MPSKKLIIIGGGAAGFFAAVNCAEKNPDCDISILERSSSLLSKVKISGGGRCNVTNGCSDIRELVKYYPRGEKQLLGPFTKFATVDAMNWFENRGVELKTEPDGRVFPISDSSQTIIDALMDAALKAGVKIKNNCGVNQLSPLGKGWTVTTTNGNALEADAVLLASGSAPGIWEILAKLGHKIIPAKPSLFTFNIRDERIKGLEGLSCSNSSVSIQSNEQARLFAEGPLLITHWGMSGPAILKLSAFGARVLAGLNYSFSIEVNWVNRSANEILESIQNYKQHHPKKLVQGNPLFEIPRRLWERLVNEAIKSEKISKLTYGDLSKKNMADLAAVLNCSLFEVRGKATFKDEFVTAGGVDLSEVDFKTMQSKKFPGLYFAGEVLDIDALTGGFNFQAAWTTAWIAANAI